MDREASRGRTAVTYCTLCKHLAEEAEGGERRRGSNKTTTTPVAMTYSMLDELDTIVQCQSLQPLQELPQRKGL